MTDNEAEIMEKGSFQIGQLYGRRFIIISLIYFIIGTTWMGPIGTILPGPSGVAGNVYDTAHWHVVFVGFLAFFILGSLYYTAPRLGGKDMYSKRLASIHFWGSNVLFPMAVVLFTWIAFAFENVLNSPTFSVSSMPSSLLLTYFTVLIIMFVGIGLQGVMAYNVFMTLRTLLPRQGEHAVTR
ncbi:MAG: cbb3-type cytochrome c oxidase subunit I [Candidatus Thermoplasmatota archaeon]|jgi:cbb3-type cytochrome oxidase subunit 1|nr:cbb3-type cytochrome c oxidase subunit I [Candidatus Thermoplasmatota archaeon]